MWGGEGLPGARLPDGERLGLPVAVEGAGAGVDLAGDGSDDAERAVVGGDDGGDFGVAGLGEGEVVFDGDEQFAVEEVIEAVAGGLPLGSCVDDGLDAGVGDGEGLFGEGGADFVLGAGEEVGLGFLLLGDFAVLGWDDGDVAGDDVAPVVEPEEFGAEFHVAVAGEGGEAVLCVGVLLLAVDVDEVVGVDVALVDVDEGVGVFDGLGVVLVGLLGEAVDVGDGEGLDGVVEVDAAVVGEGVDASVEHPSESMLLL